MALQLKTLHADFGVEISGCDLSKPLDDKDFQAIRDAFFHHSVVVIRDQNLTAEAQCAFLRRFGTPKIAQRKEFQVPGVPEIGRLGNTKNPDGTPSAFLDRHGNLWHSDTASDEQSRILGVTMLYCVKTPEQGGDTTFVSSVNAIKSLPAAERATIQKLTVVHNFNKHNDSLLAKNPGSARPLSAEDRAKWPDREHDVVQTHPITGEPCLFVTPTLVKKIGALSEAESEKLAEKLVAHATRPEAVLRHQWRAGDLVFWDNVATMHSASPADYKGGDRLMHRGYAYIDSAQQSASAAV
jgi:taurine dioxygenase